MKKLIVLLALIGCAKTENQPSCNVTKVSDGAIISCPDGTKTKVTNGSNGVAPTTTLQDATQEQCPTGGHVINFSDQIDPIVICNGLKGNTGDVGLVGPMGPTGPQGASGSSGSSCSVYPVPNSEQAPNGGAYIGCQNGTSALVVNGRNGSDGAPGTVVTPVQFCPGYITAYPTTFPEFGFTIGHSLFGVYWDQHNAWLALIPPGHFMSTSTSAPCNFTVNQDGTITN